MRLLIRLSGDIGTKARATRSRFTRRLVRNLAAALEAHGFQHVIERTWSRIFIDVDDPGAIGVVSRVFGVQSFSVVESRLGTSLEAVVAAGCELFAERVRGQTFAVRARRSGDKRAVPYNSQDIQRALGAALLPHAAGVDLSHPQVTVQVEIHDGQAHFFSEQLAAHGGLPVGVGGRAVVLMSGGFDSAVAAWLMLKRGVALNFVFCNLGGEEHQRDVIAVARALTRHWSYGAAPRLHAVDFQPLTQHLRAQCQERYWQILLKRLMCRAAESVATAWKAPAIVTGEAIGQVSSQTLENLAVIDRATDMCVLRPLLGWNKEEIIDRARRIGTHDLSAQVPEYCAMVPHQPATRASLKTILKEEEKLDSALLAAAVEQREIVDLAETPAPGDRVSIEIDHVPEGAAVIDLRNRLAYDGWHYPGAVQLDYDVALRVYPSLPQDKPYVLYCEVALKSAHLAEQMRQAGFEAYNFHGGLKGIVRYAGEHGEAVEMSLVTGVAAD